MATKTAKKGSKNKASSKTDAAKAQREAAATGKSKKSTAIDITGKDLAEVEEMAAEEVEEEIDADDEEGEEMTEDEAPPPAKGARVKVPHPAAEAANPDVPHTPVAGGRKRAPRSPAGDKRANILERFADRIEKGASRYGEEINGHAHAIAVQLRELATKVKGKSPTSDRRTAAEPPKVGDKLTIRKSGKNLIGDMVSQAVLDGEVEVLVVSGEGKKLKVRSLVDENEVFFLNARNVQPAGSSEEEEGEEEETDEEDEEELPPLRT